MKVEYKLSIIRAALQEQKIFIKELMMHEIHTDLAFNRLACFILWCNIITVALFYCSTLSYPVNGIR